MVASTRLVSAAVQLSYKSNFAIASIAKEPVNSMNLALWQELGETLDKLEEDKNVLGVIWKSGLKRDVKRLAKCLPNSLTKYSFLGFHSWK